MNKDKLFTWNDLYRRFPIQAKYTEMVLKKIASIKEYARPFYKKNSFHKLGMFPFLKTKGIQFCNESLAADIWLIWRSKTDLYALFAWIDSLRLPKHYKTDIKRDIDTILKEKKREEFSYLDNVYLYLLDYLSVYLRCLNNRLKEGILYKQY